MIQFLTFASLLAMAYGQQVGAYGQWWNHGGWDPKFCCYPVPDVCCPSVVATTTPPTCPPCLDVAFVVDISSSIGNVRLQTIINPFLQMFANSGDWEIGTGDGQVQASCTTFSNNADLLWNWMSPQTADAVALSTAFGGLTTTQFQGLTNTGAGLKVTREQVLEGPGNRPDCPDVCLVITDGHVTKDPDVFVEEAPKFKAACDLSVVVGITTEVDPDELEQIATNFDNIIMIEEFEELAGIFDDIMDMISCPGGGGVTNPATMTPSPPGCCPYEFPFYLQLVGH